MKRTNLWSYSLVALFAAGPLSLACGSSGSSSGSGGSGNETGGSMGSGGGSNSGGTSNGGSSNNVAPGAICKRVAEIQCAGEAKCCSNPGRTMADCQTAQETACGQTLSLDTVAKDPITGFDMAKSTAALTKFEQLANSCDTTIAMFGISIDGFRGIAAGTVAAGGTCNPAAGSNKLAATAAALVSCKDPANNACLPAESGDWKCTARADAGGHCFSDANCKDGLYCDNPMLSLAGGSCVARKATGAACMGTTDCTSLWCGMDGKCAEQTKDTAYCLNM